MRVVKHWRGSRGPTARSIQGQFGLGSDQPDIIEDVHGHYRGIGLDDL